MVMMMIMINNIIDKKAKEIKKSVTKRKTMLENYTDFLFNDKIILQLQQGSRSDNHEVYTKNFNKISICRMMIRDHKHFIKSQISIRSKYI